MAQTGTDKQSNSHETPVDDPYIVYRGPPEYTFASLPYTDHLVGQYVGGSVDFAFRMTSPYDPYYAATTTGVDKNSNATGTNLHFSLATLDGNGLDGTTHPASYYAFYAGIYKYYHTVSCRYKIHIENTTNRDLWIFWGYRGKENWPTRVTHLDMLAWRGIQGKRLKPKIRYYNNTTGAEQREQTATASGTTSVAESFAAAADSRTGAYIGTNDTDNVMISGTYTQGDYKREIREDEDVENWCLVNRNPTLPELLQIRAYSYGPLSGTSTLEPTITFELTCELEYLVEFKELRNGLMYPTHRNPLTVTIDKTTATPNNAVNIVNPENESMEEA